MKPILLKSASRREHFICALKTKFVLAAAVAFVALTAAISMGADGSPGSVTYLDQGWSQADREMYYQISQGSQAISYDIFLNLEVADSQDLFRSDANCERFGLIPQAANPESNPEGFPIGITKTVFTEGRWKGQFIGLNCAACHTGQINYRGKQIRIEGGNGSAFDIMAFICALDDAMQATLTHTDKFDRLTVALKLSSADAKNELLKRFESEAERIHRYRTRDIVTPSPWGPGRIDAIAAIVNRIVADKTEIPQNFSTPLAPTKAPFLWNSPDGSWNQWRGVQQDPIKRNEAEAMGVFIGLDLTSPTPEAGLFDSSEIPLNLAKIEGALDHLAPPKWPEDVLGKIDRQKAAEGKKLFAENCVQCHNSYPYTWTETNKYGKRFVQVGLVPGSYVGTDPGQFRDLRPYVITGPLASHLPPPYTGQKFIPTGVLYNIVQAEVLAKSLAPLNLTEDQSIALHGYREFPLPEPKQGFYKAAPREGVWATPPFLHNGSVPNLYEMLIPAKERTKRFYVGKEFDPIKVGLDMSEQPGAFLLDTTLPGNSNQGHSFEDGARGNGVIGRLLTDEERWAIIEYLKSIPEKAGQVTPFGGAPDSKAGSGKWNSY
jgi:hypothetical protein